MNTLAVLYLLWLQLYRGDPGGVHHRLGPAQVLYEALPLGRQAHEAAPLGVEGGVNPVLKVLWRRDLGPLLFLLAEHPQVREGVSLPGSTRPCNRDRSPTDEHKTRKQFHRYRFGFALTPKRTPVAYRPVVDESDIGRVKAVFNPPVRQQHPYKRPRCQRHLLHWRRQTSV